MVFFFCIARADAAEIFIDARETAPAAASADMYLDADGEFVRERALNGPLAAGIPGLPAGLAHLARHYGKLSLAVSLAPAITLARDGLRHRRALSSDGWISRQRVHHIP